MATVFATLTDALGNAAPVYATRSKASQKITSSGVSQILTFTAEGGEYLRVSTTGGSVALMVSDAPVAVSGAAGGHFIQDGQAIDLGPMKRGDKMAVIDA